VLQAWVERNRPFRHCYPTNAGKTMEANQFYMDSNRTYLLNSYKVDFISQCDQTMKLL